MDACKPSGKLMYASTPTAAASAGEAQSTKPKRTYNTNGFKKRNGNISRHKRAGNKKDSGHNFLASRIAIGNETANAQQIGAALDTRPKITNRQRSPSKSVVKRQRIFYVGALNKIQYQYERRTMKVKKLQAENKGLLNRVNDEKKASRLYSAALIDDAELNYKLANDKLNEALYQKRYVFI